MNQRNRRHPLHCGVATWHAGRFNAGMTRLLTVLSACALLGACSSTQKEPPRQIPIGKANVLPLALSDEFSFRKVSIFLNDPRDLNAVRPTLSPMLNFERQRVNFGAVSGYDRAERYGHYYNIWWRSKRPANLTVRFEYRQENLGSHVQAKEFKYENAQGTIESKFTIIGDEYAEDGKVTAWRVLLIENGKIVGLRQSFLWN